jgi:ferredoxin
MASIAASSALSTSFKSSLKAKIAPRTLTSYKTKFSCSAAYKVTLVFKNGDEKVIDCEEDDSIVTAAEDAGLDLPYSCRAGACCSCAGKIVDGSVDQEEQTFLEEDAIADGWVLTCVAKPLSDVKVMVELEDELPN